MSCTPPLSGPPPREGRAYRTPARRRPPLGPDWPCRSYRRSRSLVRQRRVGARRSRAPARAAHGPRRDNRRSGDDGLAAQSRRARREEHFSSDANDSSTERLTLWRLWLSEADRKTLISSNAARARDRLSRTSRARSKPRSLGISTPIATSSGTSICASTSGASASCGITSERTKLVTSRRRKPVRTSMSINSTLRSVEMISGSF